jgi:hypothetical protein
MERLMGELERALNKLAKWRSVFAGWQLGTRPKGEPESDAVRDHREVSIILRAEVSALASILIAKKICTTEEWAAALEKEAVELDKLYEAKFPGFKTHEFGVDIDVSLAQHTTKGWRP